ncbi:hypothetical protein C9J01_08155 [Photobacterium rosenbergii]|uniref:Uncharacterized protein n=1 Tax=Photobacterium rosenbergii TaxID=294936 RepID=A0A2T3NHC7_9GAMM|nr:hypothetical protein [Photobacterium rosenbergii]PSW14401.1 hypothetical protein C9J01_08155 [Photobacterium rosenbergii]
MKTELINSETKLAIDNQLSEWLQLNEKGIDSVPYKAAIVGTDGNAYRTITVSGLDGLFKLSNDLSSFGLVDLLKDSAPVRGYEAIYVMKEKS